VEDALSDDEMGEDEMDEWGEDEIEEYDDEEEEEAPALVPINTKTKKAQLKAKKPKVDLDYATDSPSSEEGSLRPSEINSSEFDSDEGQDAMENPHGFIFSHQLDTYKKSKKERNIIQMKEREATKDDRKA